MTTDPFPEGSGGAISIGGRDGRDRRHGERLGHDRADDGDDAGVRDDRRGGAGAAARPRALRAAVDDTFNAITVDGECSTNDCVMLLGERRQRRRRRRRHVSRRLLDGLRRRLPRSRARHRPRRRGRDEAASPSPSPARASDRRRQADCAKAIANSPLVKTAIHGGDPNWGRLIAVAGRAGVAVRAGTRGRDHRIDHAVRGRPSLRSPCAGGRRVSAEGRDLNGRSASGRRRRSRRTVWTCDLSAEVRAGSTPTTARDSIRTWASEPDRELP